ncbi:endo-beta-N-acetylglucosaminidase [Nocardiopsis synnemataformans]|uniref:endo-beta-N-acetylglucosaminidase n=1 Tax=Nocardiopsis synnemataformans TaxID=61305 RepID=UPI003EBD2985
MNDAQDRADGTAGVRPPGRLNRRTFLGGTGLGVAASLLPWGAAPASAAPTPAAHGAETGPLPPLMHGYSAPQVKAWSPETDTHAPYLRSRVPLAARLPAFSPTQARPGLDPRPRLMSLANDYLQPGYETAGYPYGTGFDAYALRFWQYPDLYASWHGLPLEGEHGAEEPQYGFLNLPNPGYTDAAHRNGVLSLGCWFWPRPEDFADAVEQNPDGSFPMADKLVEMAEYFGFDGYFVNQEDDVTGEQAVLLMEFLSYLADRAPEGFHVQWYDALTVEGRVSYQNEFNDVNSPWIVTGDGERVCDSVFLNYWWNEQRVRNSREHALSLGLDPYEVVYTGQEIGLNRFAQSYDPRLVFPEGGEPRTSWAFLGAEMVWYTVEGAKDSVEAQAPAYTRERHLWSGPLQDPSRTGRTAPPDTADPLDPRGWDGTAHSIVEKSVIGSLPFVTGFCAGTGLGFFVDGRKVGDDPWYNIGVQDLLPTWQWWVRDGDGEPADDVVVDYDYTTAFDGGNSLKVSGALAPGGSVLVRLFKTGLTVTASTVLRVVHDLAGDGPVAEIALVFQDTPQEWERLALLDSARPLTGGWSESEVALEPWAGREIAAIALSVHAGEDAEEAADVAVRLGRLTVAERGEGPVPATPAAPTVDGFERDGDTASVYLRWEPVGGARHYDLFHVHGESRAWVGRICGEAFCVGALRRPDGAASSAIEVEAVTPLGRRSAPARVALTW